jgi:N-acetylglucosamine-6-phosphate deacetylase
MDNKGVVCELIVDNVHVYPAMQRLLLKVKV